MLHEYSPVNEKFLFSSIGSISLPSRISSLQTFEEKVAVFAVLCCQ